MPAVHITNLAALQNIRYTSSARFMPVCQDSEVKSMLTCRVCILLVGEWISGAVCMYVANAPCENYNTDEQVYSHYVSAGV